MVQVAVVGGGINGLCCAWQLAQAGYHVALFERNELMQQTSSASSKLLHGGIRYLENFEFRLVHEALNERKWWLDNVPKLTRRLPILYPIYPHTRPRWKMKIGMVMYDFLAGKKGIGRHRWLTPHQVKRCSPQLKQKGLQGAYLFSDGQMDDHQLGLWVADQCTSLGVNIKTGQAVQSVSKDGVLRVNDTTYQFDWVINVAGPWSEALLDQSNIKHDERLDLVRGSHLVLPAISKFGHLLEEQDSARVVFVLPYHGKTLLGTTEVKQTLSDPIAVSPAEKANLLNLYNQYFTKPVNEQDILHQFAGIRPLLAGDGQLNKNSREYKIRQDGQLISVFGGKWTTSRALARAVCQKITP
ncbi:Aerobic glycerol-3-phosphate dehydrogenase [Pseudoalteromonas luteoviolacea B = ATCC 29581]|nr:Aerobic glycerol-3-phosphate dehydrogenase [Pseudoalteromonas luteoviolacea B = ATCC 29581]